MVSIYPVSQESWGNTEILSSLKAVKGWMPILRQAVTACPESMQIAGEYSKHLNCGNIPALAFKSFCELDHDIEIFSYQFLITAGNYINGQINEVLFILWL